MIDGKGALVCTSVLFPRVALVLPFITSKSSDEWQATSQVLDKIIVLLTTIIQVS